MLVATLFLISAIFWLGISFGHIVTQSHSHILATGRQTTINEATLLRNYTVNYPIFHDQKLDSIIKQYVSNQIDTFENKLVNHSDTRNYLDISYTFLQAGTRSATIEFNTRVVYAGKPDVFNRHYMTLDLVEKREITSKDILKQNPEARTLLARLLHDYFKHQPSVQLSSVDLVEILEMSMANLSDVYLRADTMVLSFNPYSPAAGSGRVSAAISKRLLHGILNDDYLADTYNMISVPSLKVAYQISERPPAGDIVNPAEKMLALTFDDGPSAMTNTIVDRLEAYEAHATFFVLGYAVSGHTTELQNILHQGSEIGNHSWNHVNLQFVAPAELDHQLTSTQQAIQAATNGYTPRLMRPPYGATRAAIRDHLATRGLTQALWNVDTQDWLDHNPELIYQRIMAGARDGAVILLHDIYPASMEASLRAIRDLKAQGYQLVTLSQMYQYR
jgi:peptidoglycan/xylan/chitin deacetylase (PgdA/CDA1 family)